MAGEIKALKGRKILTQGNALGKGVSKVAAQAEGHSVHEFMLRRKVEELISPH